MQAKKMLPTTYLLIALIAMLLFHFLLPGVMIIPMPWNALGIIPLGVGLIINLAADSLLRKAQTTVKPFEEPSALVTDGVYRLSRHPMYLGFVLILTGIAILLRSLTPWAIVVVFAVLMDRIFIQVEERMLEKRFGPAWQDYKSKTRRWL
jgi:protein-S-isoprenylcysteine O-methyltransferase Ste14